MSRHNPSLDQQSIDDPVEQPAVKERVDQSRRAPRS